MPGLLLFFFALLVRLVVQYGLSANPSFSYPLVDAGWNHKLALALLDSASVSSLDTLPPHLFWRSVFFPVYLATAHFTSGSSILAAKLFQAVLGAFTCWLTYHLGRRYFGSGCGWTAGIISALYGPLIFWESELVAVGWAAFWSVALLWIALKSEETGSLGFHLAFGLVGALAVLTRPSFLPFVLVTIVWLAWSAGSGVSGGSRAAALARLSRGGLALLGFLIVALPTAMASRSVADHASFLPRAGALNFYIGNHPERCAMLGLRPGEEWRQLRALTQSSQTDGPGPYWDAAIDHATSNPLAFASGIFHKLGQLANGREIPRNLDLYVFRQWSPVLAALVWKAGGFGFPFGLLLPMAAIGLLLRRREVPKPLLIFVASYPLVIAATFVAGRYRAPVAPALAILAAAACVEIHARIRGRRWGAALLPLALGAALLAAAHRADPYCEEAGSFHAEMVTFVAIDASAAGDTQLALELLQEAVRIDPRSERAHEELGDFYALGREFDLALRHYDTAIRLSEQYWVLRARGALHFTRGDLELALDDFDRAIALNPNYSPAYLGRGRVHLRRGELDWARIETRQSLKSAKSEREAKAARAMLKELNFRERREGLEGQKGPKPQRRS